jgi:predicted CopG family antitoxin
MGTTIHVSDETWKRLNTRKARGETFDDIVSQLLDQAEADANAEDTEDDSGRDE